MKEKIKKILRLENITDKQPPKRVKYIIIIGLIALLFILIGNMFSSKSTQSIKDPPIINDLQEDQVKETSSKEPEAELIVTELEESYENDLKEMLDNIQGVSEVEVMVNLDSTNVKVYEKNLITGQQITDESDTNGGIRKVEDQTEERQVVLVRQGDQEVPLLVQTEKPQVRGVFVVAKGVDHATVKMWVIEAVARVLDVPTHKVSVMPKN